MAWKKHDWKRARELYEHDGKNFSEIAEIVGCDKHTVSDHAKREGWVNPQQILKEAAPQRAEAIFEEFVQQSRSAVLGNLAEKHGINRRLLALVGKHIERLENGVEFAIQIGEKKDGEPILVHEDPVLSLRRLALAAQSIEAMDRSIADLKDSGWRKVEEAEGDESAVSKLTPDQLAKLLRKSSPPTHAEELN